MLVFGVDMVRSPFAGKLFFKTLNASILTSRMNCSAMHVSVSLVILGCFNLNKHRVEDSLRLQDTCTSSILS